LLANDFLNKAEFRFLLSDPTPDNETDWGYSEEVRIHYRMFRPELFVRRDPSVPPEIWLQWVTVTLTPEEEFSERPEFYSTSERGYLDPAKWRATSATYTTYLLFALAGDTNYRIEGRADFVVIEDLTKDVEDDGKFLLLIWEDPGNPTSKDIVAGVGGTTWSHLKLLYR
jgi:hypothetical protein